MIVNIIVLILASLINFYVYLLIPFNFTLAMYVFMGTIPIILTAGYNLDKIKDAYMERRK